MDLRDHSSLSSALKALPQLYQPSFYVPLFYTFMDILYDPQVMSYLIFLYDEWQQKQMPN